MSVLDLRHTHKLVFRQTIATLFFCVIIGIGMVIMPEIFFASDSYKQIIGELASPMAWGIVWLICSALMLMGMTRLTYKFTQAGLMIFSVICVLWSFGLLLIPIVSQASAYTGAAIWGLIGVRTFVLALEPPINPLTAIHIGKNEEDE